MMTIFFTLHKLRIMFILTSAKNFHCYLRDDRSRYLTMLMCLLPIPFVDYCFCHFRYHIMFHLVNLLGLIHSVVQVSFASLDVQVFGILVFSFDLCFLIYVVFSYHLVFLGKNALGKGNGLMTLFVGLFGPLAVPMANFTVKQRNENLFVLNLINLSLTILLTLLACSIGQMTRKKERQKRC